VARNILTECGSENGPGARVQTPGPVASGRVCTDDVALTCPPARAGNLSGPAVRLLPWGMLGNVILQERRSVQVLHDGR
jgi:hypothetical protein